MGTVETGTLSQLLLKISLQISAGRCWSQSRMKILLLAAALVSQVVGRPQQGEYQPGNGWGNTRPAQPTQWSAWSSGGGAAPTSYNSYDSYNSYNPYNPYNSYVPGGNKQPYLRSNSYATACSYAHACSYAPAYATWELRLWGLWPNSTAKQMSTGFWTSDGSSSWPNCDYRMWCLRQRYAHLWGSVKWMDAREQLDDQTLASAARTHAYAHA